MNFSTDAKSRNRTREFVFAVLVLWFSAALCCSAFGLFDSGRRPPATIGLAAALPVLGFIVGYLLSQAFRRRILDSADLRLLTLAQTWRVGGIVFLILYRRDLLPGVFALPAGLGDMLVGVTAPWIAWAIASPAGFPRLEFVLWNLIGLLDLVTAVALGVLASASPLGILAHGGITTRIMGAFPLSLIPTFFVPVPAILHLIALARVHQNSIHSGGPKCDD